MKQLILSFSFFLVTLPFLIASETPFIQDYTNTLTQEQLATINALSKEIQHRDNIEFRTILVDRLDPGKSSRSQATQLANKLGVGQHNEERGALIFFSVKDRKLFIATSKAVKQQLTEPAIDEVIKLYMKPLLKMDNYAAAIEQGIAGLSKQILSPKSFITWPKWPKWSIPAIFAIFSVIGIFVNFFLFRGDKTPGQSFGDDGFDSGFGSGGSDGGGSFDGSGSGDDY